MKKQLFAISCMAVLLASCKEDALEINPEVTKEGVYATIEQPMMAEYTKSLNWGTNNDLVFTWAKNENVVVFGETDAALLRSLSAGESSTKLESKGFQLIDGINYYAYIPSSTFIIDSKSTEIPVVFTGQRQVSNGSTAHLKDYDYACASATKSEGENSLSFELKNQVAWIVLEHRFAEETKNVVSVTISSEESVFVTSEKLDVTSASYKYPKKSKEMTLDLGAESGDGLSFVAGELFRGFITVSPVDLSGKALTIKANLSDGTALDLGTYTFETINLQKNYVAVIRTKGTSEVKSVASIDGVEYATVNAAINAAVNGTKSVTIDILEDINENLVIEDTNEKGRTITLDFHGKKLSVIGESAVAVLVKSRGSDSFKNTLQIKNAIISSEFVGIKFDPKTSRTDLALYDCTINSAQGAVCTSQAVGSQIRIYGGYFSAINNAVIAGNGSNREGRNTISLDASSTTKEAPVIVGKTSTSGDAACGIYAPWKDIITINAAKINVENGVGILSRGGKITINNAEIVTTEPSEGYKGSVGDSRVVVPCKTVFIDTECDYPALSEASILIKGGKYSDNAGASYVAQGYSYAETGESPLAYEIVSSETKLIQDINSVAENGTVLVEDYVSLKSEPIKIQKNFILELAENAVITAGYTGSNVLNFCKENGNNTITGTGTVIGPKASSSAAIWVGGENQTLTIDGNVTIKGGESTNSSKDIASAVNIYNGKLVINNGTFISGTDASGNNSPAIYLTPRANETAILEINGGTFKSVSGKAQFLINCADDATSRCKVSIKGGIFYGFNPADNNADGAHTNYVAEGYTVNYDEASNSYTVVEAIGSTISSQEDLNNAITGAVQGEAVTVNLPSNSTFTLDNGIAHEGTKSRNITFEGNGTQTVDVVKNSITSSEGEEMNYQRGSTFTFKNVTIQGGTTPYGGIVCDELTYVECTIKGKLTLYGQAKFIDCVFENDMENQYSIWTWGGTDVEFTGCTFNTNGKAILLFAGPSNTKPTNLVVTNCIFNDSEKYVVEKAAIETGNDYGSTYNLVINKCTVNGFAINPEGTNTKSRLWANKKSMDAEHLSVIIDGVKIY